MHIIIFYALCTYLRACTVNEHILFVFRASTLARFFCFLFVFKLKIVKRPRAHVFYFPELANERRVVQRLRSVGFDGTLSTAHYIIIRVQYAARAALNRVIISWVRKLKDLRIVLYMISIYCRASLKSEPYNVEFKN